MSKKMETVLIFKAASEEPEKDPYSNELEKIGLLTKNICVLDFIYKNLHELAEKMRHPDMYSGIIFTSPRCVRAVLSALDRESLHPGWQQLLTFAVGESTARLVRDNLQLDPRGSNAGNGFTLAPIIVECKPSKPLLLPCGNLKMDTLENLLTSQGVITEVVEVYETVPHPHLEQSLSATLAECQPSYVVYFSPSGVHNTYPLLVKSGIHLGQVKWVSIGPTTASALQSYGLKVYRSAAKPTPQSLAEAFLQTEN